MDSEQSYRDNETTTPERIRAHAADHGVAHVETISLADGQFRCGGSREYLQWIENVLAGRAPGESDRRWRASSAKRAAFRFEIVSDPQKLDDNLENHLSEGHSARLVASYARKWTTKGIERPHDLPAGKKDFHIEYLRDGKKRYYTKVWNFVPKEDYTMFIQGRPGSGIHDAPLSEVGCPYVMRGFDFDYLGVLWLNDFVWREDRWVAQLEHVHETAWPRTKKSARKKIEANAEPDELMRRLQRGYRILLSRAIKGLYVWFEDEETRQHIASLLPK